MSVEPGRPISLGVEEDLIDAAALLDVMRACSGVRDRWTAGSTHVAREALWSFWERPRLPKPLVSGKYPKSYPWSASARAAYTAKPQSAPGGRGLILEHLRPRNGLINYMIMQANVLTADALIDYLNKFLAAAIITSQENLALTNAGVGNAPIDPNDPDPWARHRTAGFDPVTYGPLLA